jgi:hypothetical protein
MVVRARWLIVGAGALLAAVAINAYIQREPPPPKHYVGMRYIVGDPNLKTIDGRPIPPQGAYTFPHTIGHRGDPNEAVKDFKRLYAAIDEYRRRHDRLPTMAVLKDRKSAFNVENGLTEDDYRNPDYKFSEHSWPDGRVANISDYAINFGSLRPNGEQKPVYTKEGELDVWAYSNLTAKSNAIEYQDGSRDHHFAGEYVVLFSDGSIKQFKHRETLYVESSWLPGPMLAFPGQTGYERIVWTWDKQPIFQSNPMVRVTYGD